MKNKYKHIEKALKDGYTIHGFRSGGGLRVLTMSKKDEIDRYYGESCNLQEALRILNDDIKAGGRKYEDVYGKIETHYWTGAYSSDVDPVDAWVCSGRKFDVHFDTQFIVDMTQEEYIETPQAVINEVHNYNKTVFWKVVGKENPTIFKSSPSTFPNGEKCVSTSCDGGMNQKMNVIRIATGKNLNDALNEASEKCSFKFEPEWFRVPEPINEEI